MNKKPYAIYNIDRGAFVIYEEDILEGETLEAAEVRILDNLREQGVFIELLDMVGP